MDRVSFSKGGHLPPFRNDLSVFLADGHAPPYSSKNLNCPPLHNILKETLMDMTKTSISIHIHVKPD